MRGTCEMLHIEGCRRGEAHRWSIMVAVRRWKRKRRRRRRRRKSKKQAERRKRRKKAEEEEEEEEEERERGNRARRSRRRETIKRSNKRLRLGCRAGLRCLSRSTSSPNALQAPLRGRWRAPFTSASCGERSAPSAIQSSRETEESSSLERCISTLCVLFCARMRARSCQWSVASRRFHSSISPTSEIFTYDYSRLSSNPRSGSHLWWISTLSQTQKRQIPNSVISLTEQRWLDYLAKNCSLIEWSDYNWKRDYNWNKTPILRSIGG